MIPLEYLQSGIIVVLTMLVIVLVIALIRDRKAIDKRSAHMDYVLMAESQGRPPESAAAATALENAAEEEPISNTNQDVDPGSDIDIVEELARTGSMSFAASRALDDIEEKGRE